MRLEDIGFYTLSDDRAYTASQHSRLYRCELILTSACNFNCPYCRGMKDEDKGSISRRDAFETVKQWASNSLKCIRFSGGEPTIWPYLVELVAYAKKLGIERIALSTNGSATMDTYIELFDAGINDFSISLDSCCSSTGNKMSGRDDAWQTVVENIKGLSALTYVTVGVVITKDNYREINDIIRYATSLGVHDIRIIPAAQLSKELQGVHIEQDILNKHPILKYRYNNFINGIAVRGLKKTDNHQCPLVLDDMAVLNGKHYPCIIYMREHGKPIGRLSDSMDNVRAERVDWFEKHDCYNDDICRNNCLDVCVDYNNKVRLLRHCWG